MGNELKKYFANPRKIKEVKPLENYILLITFDNGEKRKYSMPLNVHIIGIIFVPLFLFFHQQRIL